MRIQCSTYNGHLGQGGGGPLSNSLIMKRDRSKGQDDDELGELSSWLLHSTPTTTTRSKTTRTSRNDEPSQNDSRECNSVAPDLVAVGFQEMIPLHLALAGFTSTALDLHEDKIRRAIEQTHSTTTTTTRGGKGTSYSLVARKSLGGIALLVYSNDQTLTDQLRDVQIATAGCGIFNLMGNKGAVGIRFSLQASNGQSSSWTFVTAHLAAHQNKVERRNNDWKDIVRRLVFVDDRGRAEKNLYETGHLFVFGDLNYRISLTSPKKLAPHLLSHHISTLVSPTSDQSSLSSSLSTLLPHDQLQQELRQGKTLHHLREGPLHFPPTYKFKPGTVDTYKDFKKRIPGWCDRVLYAVPTREEGETGGCQVEHYDSAMTFTASDHKPVTALFNIPSPSSQSLSVTSPYTISPSWRRAQTLGTLLDRVVGLVWCLIMLAGLNRDVKLGLVNLTVAALSGYVWKFGLDGRFLGGWKLLS